MNFLPDFCVVFIRFALGSWYCCSWWCDGGILLGDIGCRFLVDVPLLVTSTASLVRSKYIVNVVGNCDEFVFD